MLNFLGQRILQLIPTLFFVSVLIFSLQHLLPGDPALVMAGEERDPEVIAQIRAQYHLDQPIPVQYVYWIKGVLSGDFGESLRTQTLLANLLDPAAIATPDHVGASTSPSRNELIERIVDAIEERVIDELERRGRRHHPGVF